ncbi:MAG: helix-turn-helix transcriptional regulator [Spirochaetia bacterium]|nr:helix-turn-helix transcriptional regulator [Spirochaetia bacterium]
MKGLEYSTVLIFTSLLLMIVTIALAVVSKTSKQGNGWVYFIVAGFLLVLSGLTEGIPRGFLMERTFWGTLQIALNIFGIAFVYSGMRSILGIGMPVGWNVFVGILNTAIVFGLYYTVPQMRGFRTIAYGFSLYLLALPILVRDFSRPPVFHFQRIFDRLLSASLLVDGLRVLFAFLDPVRDEFISDKLDSWLILLFAVFGMLSFVSFILMVIGLKSGGVASIVNEERPVIVLSEHGLTRMQTAYVMSLLRGASIKEIACEAGVSDSTVRNTLAKVYKKLGVHNMVGLMQLAGKAEIRA